MEDKIEIVTEDMKVNDKLYYKMQKEQELYMEDMEFLTAKEVLAFAEEIAIRNTILQTMSKYDLPMKAAKGLLHLEKPLAFLYSDFLQYHFTAEGTFKNLMQHCGENLFNGLIVDTEPKEILFTQTEVV